MKLFQYAIIKHPTEEEKKNGSTSELLVGVETVLAPDEQAAILKAGRAIPESEMNNLDRLEVAVRPF